MADLNNTLEFFATMKRVCAIRTECPGCPFVNICGFNQEIPAVAPTVTFEMLNEIIVKLPPAFTDEEKAFLCCFDDPKDMVIKRIEGELLLTEYSLTIAHLNPEMFAFLPVGDCERVKELQKWLDT